MIRKKVSLLNYENDKRLPFAKFYFIVSQRLNLGAAEMKALTGIILFFCSHALTNGFKLEPKVPGRGRIVGGTIIVAPYQVSLLYRGYHRCGG